MSSVYILIRGQEHFDSISAWCNQSISGNCSITPMYGDHWADVVKTWVYDFDSDADATLFTLRWK